MRIPFNKPFLSGKELDYIRQAYDKGVLAGNGEFTHRCQQWLQQHTGCLKAILTNSGTAALEMAAILADIRPGDEVIMPSFTFVTTATSFVMRGGVPVFVDICPDTLNIDPQEIEKAITPKTKAIVVVHYAGVGCAMDMIMAIAQRHGILVIEDAAHGVAAAHKGKALGSIGHLAAVSFHETKNIISGEGGALLVNDKRFCERAQIIAEKGTNRSQFLNGQVDRYTWVDEGSSFMPSELTAAFLWAQMESAAAITQQRIALWQAYHEALLPLEQKGVLRRPIIPADSTHNAHMYYVLLNNVQKRDAFINSLKQEGILSVFHYVPLHSSPAGKKYGRAHGDLKITDNAYARLARLPLWVGLAPHQSEVIKAVQKFTDLPVA